MLFHSFHSGTHFNHVNQARQTVSRWEPPWNPSNFSFLSFQLCFSGCGIVYFFHFFVFFISFRARNALFLSFLCVFHFFQGRGWSISFIYLCFSFLSGHGMLYFFHFFVFFISFRVRDGLFLSFLLWPFTICLFTFIYNSYYNQLQLLLWPFTICLTTNYNAL